MTYSFMKTNCSHEVVQTKVWEKWHESENALKYPISLLLLQKGGEIKEDYIDNNWSCIVGTRWVIISLSLLLWGLKVSTIKHF